MRPQRPPNFGTSYICAHSMRKDNQILHGDRNRCEENNSPGRPRMPTRDLFAVAITFLFDELNGLKVIDHSVVVDKTIEGHSVELTVDQPGSSADNHSRYTFFV